VTHKPCRSCGAPGLFLINGKEYCSDHAKKLVNGELHVTYLQHRFVDGLCSCGQTEYRPFTPKVIGNVRYVRVRS